VVAALVVVVYAGYLAYNGQKIPSNKDEIVEHGRQKLNDLKEKAAKELLKEKEQIKERVKEEVMQNI
jgi:F0F1-type ATP synthase membrane subunit b/b'